MNNKHKDESIQEMLEDGYSYSAIQEELGVSPNRIAKVKKELDGVDDSEEYELSGDDEVEGVDEESKHYLYITPSTFDKPIFGTLPKKINEYALPPTIEKFGNRLNGELKQIIAVSNNYVSQEEAKYFLQVCLQAKERFIDFGIDYDNSLHISLLNTLESHILNLLQLKNTGVKFPKDKAVKFILQFLDLVNDKVVDFDLATEFLENLQESIKNQEIRLTSKYASQIQWIQNYLVEKLNDLDEEDEELHLTIIGSDMFEEFENVHLVHLNFPDRVKKVLLSASQSNLSYTV